MKPQAKPVKSLLTTIKGRFYLRRTFEGKQKTIPLGANSKIATTLANRFLATAASSGFESAMKELTGKTIVKPGGNPTFAEMEILYRDFCRQSAKPPREQTIKHYLARLKCVMNRAGVANVGKLDKDKLFTAWFGDVSPTPEKKRTFASAIRDASSIFKVTALEYYKKRNVPVANPFLGLELVDPKVSQYVPMPKEVRESIYKDCQTELPATEAMVVLMALGIGMRRSEIEAAIPAWFSKQADNVLVNIKEEKHFTPKAGQDGVVPISLELYEILLKLRGDSKGFFFVDGESKKETGRIWEKVKSVNKWLKLKGVTDKKPLHALRKECGSIVAKEQGILEAAKILRNTLEVCSKHYAGIADVQTVNIQESFRDKKDPFQALADQLGITVEDLKKKLSA